MNKQEVIALLEKGSKYSNYYYAPSIKNSYIKKYNSYKTEYYIKNNIVAHYENDKLVEISNYSTKEIIDYCDDIEGLLLERNYTNEEIGKYNQHGYDYSIIANEDVYHYEYEYLGEKEIDERTVILVELSDKSGLLSGKIRFAIDKETGLILERTDFTKFLFITLFKIEYDRNIKYDIVADADITKI